MDFQKLKELRQRLADSSKSLQAVHEKRFGSIPYTPSPINVPAFHLDIPPAFFTQIESYHLFSHTREVMLGALEELRVDYAKQFDDSCRKLAQAANPQLASRLPNLVETFRESLQHHFETRGLAKLLNRLDTFAKEHPPRPSPSPQPTQPPIAPYQPPVPFNNDYTPALEAYFTYDPYPSVKDRQTIASRTGMATRQIEVWFQNHRKRAREQGIVLPDKRSSGGFGDFSGEKERMLDLFNAKPTPATTTPSASTSSSSSSFSFTSSPSPASTSFTPSPTPTPSFSFSFSSSPAPSSVPSTPTAPTFSPSSSSITHTNTKPPSVIPLSLASGTGTTPDDPIHIDTSEMSMSMSREKERGMTITSAGNGVGVMELDDDVERVARRRERRKGEDGEKEREVREEMRAQRNKLLSVIRPRIRYKRRPSTPNPLDTPTYASPTAFPTAFTPPPAELQFRNRVTPPSTSFPTLPHSHSPPKNPMTKQEYKETLKTTTSLLSSLSLSLSSPSPSSPTPPKPQTRIKSLMHAFGAGIDAATCAYTYVLPKAPFWASVSVQPPSQAQSQAQAQRKKPAALGPKRNPRNAPSASPSSASSSKAKPKAVVAKRHSPTPEPGFGGGGGGGGLQRYSSQSSLASTSSSSSSSSSFTYSPPRTPPPSGPEHDSVHIFDPSPSSVFSSPFAFNPVPPTANPSSSFSSVASHPHPSSSSSFTPTPTSIPPGFPEGFVPFSQISSSTMSLPEYYTFATATKPNPKPPVSVSVSVSESMGFDFQVNHHIQDMHAINAFVDGLM
ncbi:hypothetical protein C8R42DRAFT_776085 [Lentinula raphanica]|nr:hypothetical protein C8R42DRAFT_776085 [Lentinula raphanica]